MKRRIYRRAGASGARIGDAAVVAADGGPGKVDASEAVSAGPPAAGPTPEPNPAPPIVATGVARAGGSGTTGGRLPFPPAPPRREGPDRRRSSSRPRLTPLGGAALAGVLFILAVIATPPAGDTAAEGLAGLPRFALYLAAAIALAGSRPTERERAPTRGGGLSLAQLIAALEQAPRRLAEPGPRLIAVGLAVIGVIAGWNGARLILAPDNPLSGPVWLVTLALVALLVTLPGIAGRGWAPRWPAPGEPGQLSPRFQQVRRFLLAGLLAASAAVRFPGLDVTPIGIHPDEGDRWSSAMSVLTGSASPNWFDSGWFYINMVYFRTLAIGISLFGTGVGGTRALSAFVGLGLVAVIAWVGCRHFGWRLGLVATALAAADAYLVQHSRFVSEGGISALLWGLTVAGFLEGGRRGRVWAFALAGATGGLGLYFYPSSRLWAVGAALTVAALWLGEREHRWGIFGGAAVAAAVSLIAVTPFLTHISQDPAEFTLRYLDTSVTQPDRNVRLTYNHPPVPMAELLVLQAERTLGMFDRYPDSGSFLSLDRPDLPQPLAGLMLVGIAYAVILARRDPRYAILSIWFFVGMSGVLLTIDTPDYLRASGAAATFPFFGAFVVVEVARRLGDGLPRFARDLRALGAIPPDGDAAAAVRAAVDAALAGGAVLAIGVGAYLYFGPYRLAMQPRWALITGEGTQVAALGRTGPVYALDVFDFHINAGWVRFLSQDATRGQLPNPGDQLPILATGPAAGGPGPVDAASDAPVPPPGRGLTFLLYPDPNQDLYLDLLRDLYPGGSVLDPVDGRRPYQLSAAALDQVRGVVARPADGAGPGTIVPTFGELPAGTALPTSMTWQAGVRFGWSASYQVRLAAPHPARLAIDGVEVAATAGGAPVVRTVEVARGVHFVRLTARVESPDDRVGFARSDPRANPNDPAALRPIGADEAYARMDDPWGLLGQVTARGGDAEAFGSGPLADRFLDSTIAASAIDRYVPLGSRPFTVTWRGALEVPGDGRYRLAFVADGPVQLTLDGKPVAVQQVKPEGWTPSTPGTPTELTKGEHAVQIVLTIPDGGRTVARWLWATPAPTPDAQANGGWAIVPPSALRPATPVWLPAGQ